MCESLRNRNVYSEGMTMEEAGEAASNEVFTQLGYNPFGQYYSDLSQYPTDGSGRSEEHTSELQSRGHIVCRLLLEKKKNKGIITEKKGAYTDESILITTGTEMLD